MLKDDALLQLAMGLRGGSVFDGLIYKPPRKPLKEKTPAVELKYKAKRKAKNKISTISKRKNRR